MHISGRKPSLSREEVAFYAFLLVLISFLALAAWDGYLFYTAVIIKEEAGIFVAKVPSLSAEQINEIIGLLDERQSQFQALLGVTKTQK